MTDNKWSEEQPPEWTGPPIGSTPPQQPWAPPTQPPVPAAPAAEPAPTDARVGFGELFMRMWRGFVGRIGVYLGVSSAAFAVVFTAAIATMRALLPNGLSDEANAVLKGDTKTLENLFADPEYATDAEIAAFLEILRQVGIVFAVLIVMTVVLQVIVGSALTRYALSDFAGQRTSVAEAFRTTPFLKVVSNLFALAVLGTAVFAAIAVLGFISLSVPVVGGFIFFALILTFVVFMVWLGIGVTFVNAVVVDENIGGFKAIRRALQLAQGNRLVIFGLAVLVSIASTVPANVVGTAITVLAEPGFTTFALGNGLPYVFSVPVSAVLAAVLYRNYKK